MTFYDCLMTCARSPELVAQFNRLTGRHVGEKLIRSPLDLLVDQATGYDEMLKAQQDEDLSAFIEFCHTHVWLTLPRDNAAS